LKKRHFFRRKLSNIAKILIITSTPDCEKFRHLGKILGEKIAWSTVWAIFLIFGRFFHKTSRHPDAHFFT
jgi:hypothetical protein